MQDLIDFLHENVDNISEKHYIIKNDRLYYKYGLFIWNKKFKLPESIGKLSTFSIDLKGNDIEELPETIGDIKAHFITISKNKIKKLPDSIVNLTETRELYLYKNEIEELPENIGDILVDKLSLSNNKIKVIPKSIGRFKGSILNLGNNNIKQLPEELKKCCLCNLRLDGNDLDYLNRYSGFNIYESYSIKNFKVTKDKTFVNNIKNMYENNQYVYVTKGNNEYKQEYFFKYIQKRELNDIIIYRDYWDHYLIVNKRNDDWVVTSKLTHGYDRLMNIDICEAYYNYQSSIDNCIRHIQNNRTHFLPK